MATLSRELTTQEIAEHLIAVGERCAAGWLAAAGEAPVVRFAHGLATHLRHVELSPYRSTRLYPGNRGTPYLFLEIGDT